MFKLNNFKGAIICDKCKTLIAVDVAYTERNQRYILCTECKKKDSEDD